MKVQTISGRAAMNLVMAHHYSQRKVGAAASFGLFDDAGLVGCCVFSVPASYTLCNGVCGESYRSFVWELSRLVIATDHKNAASFLVGQSLRRIGDRILVSYADCNDHVGHVGYVYQATNWLYTGQGNAEPKWIHPETGRVVSYTRRHIDKKAAAIGLDWKSLIRSPQVGKHRYVTFAGNKKFRRAARTALRYPVLEYPKGETRRHEIANEQLPLFAGRND